MKDLVLVVHLYGDCALLSVHILPLTQNLLCRFVVKFCHLP